MATHVQVFVIFCSLPLAVPVLRGIKGVVHRNGLRLHLDAPWLAAGALELWNPQPAGVASELVDAGHHEIASVREV